MITLLVEENNPLTPYFYDELINKLQLHQLTCPCGHAGSLTVHGYYLRYIKSSSGKVPFTICRVKCSSCGHTHAILLSSMVPYSQVSLMDHVSIISNFEDDHSQDEVMLKTPSIDESNYRYIIRCYKNHWLEKLRSERIHFSPIAGLVRSCFSFFSYQFMQIRHTSNILFPLTT